MNTKDAAYHTVHDYAGGSESLGPRVGISAAVLRNKVNPNNETHHLTLAEAQRIVDITDDERILRAWAHARGLLLIKAPEGSDCDMSVLEAVVDAGVAHGQWMQTIHSALADGKVDTNEVQAIKAAKRVLQTAAATATQRIEGMVG
ncbi:phage regulatory CII family protein [Achromobacter xylosoxidans]|uniref:phage regulatory CII family protein n=1 Tax=Alcaligenes xylosoxydans xylosoxydans TaxID=85698 RepID=UPI00336AE7EC